MAATLHEQLDLHAAIEPGHRGEFTVWVGDAVVARKTPEGFPTPEQCVAAVRAALAQAG